MEMVSEKGKGERVEEKDVFPFAGDLKLLKAT